MKVRIRVKVSQTSDDVIIAIADTGRASRKKIRPVFLRAFEQTKTGLRQAVALA